MRVHQENVSREGARVGSVLRAVETGLWATVWTCEKWSEEAVEYARRHILTSHADPRFYKLLSREGVDALHPRMGLPSSVLRLFVPPEECIEIHGNLLLNEGIQELLDLLIAAGGSVAAYNNATADIGVGNSATAAAATDTGLLGGSTLYKGMVATYPIRTAQTMDWRSDFTSGEANFVWAEWSIRNGNTRNKNLNRKVEALGTKATGTWTLTASVTIS